MQTFLLNFTLDVGFDTSHLDVHIREVAKFNIFLKYIFFLKHKKFDDKFYQKVLKLKLNSLTDYI